TRFEDSLGKMDHWMYPTTHEEAEQWLEMFLKQRLKHFGDYQDAFSTKHATLYHSLLSPLLNSGLLTPQYVVDRCIRYSKDHRIALNNSEGFIRQIIGWREFVRMVYSVYGDRLRKQSSFSCAQRIKTSLWMGTTGLAPVDHVVGKLLGSGYLHHNERLMILGNYALLMEYDAHQIYQWFMTLFMDAYDWVMVPNIYGMVYFGGHGLMTTKPYISSSTYIKRMGFYKNSQWASVWDALYWTFLEKHKQLLSTTGRMGLVLYHLSRLGSDKLRTYHRIRKDYLKNLE
ncbi:MAG: hypothetical protein WBQ73_02725, partial [Candidatus Babeliales bacterium]